MHEVMKPPIDGLGHSRMRSKAKLSGQPAHPRSEGEVLNQATWTIGEGEELPKTRELVATNVIRVTQKWVDGRPIDPHSRAGREISRR